MIKLPREAGLGLKDLKFGEGDFIPRRKGEADTMTERKGRWPHRQNQRSGLIIWCVVAAVMLLGMILLVLLR